MTPKIDPINRRYLRGLLDNLRENTSGADDEIRTMMAKLDNGELEWTGRRPTSKPGGRRQFGK